MRQSVTLRIDPKILEGAKAKAARDHRTLTNYVELLMRNDVENSDEAGLLVFAPDNIREATPLSFDGESPDHITRRNAIFDAVLDASGR